LIEAAGPRRMPYLRLCRTTADWSENGLDRRIWVGQVRSNIISLSQSDFGTDLRSGTGIRNNFLSSEGVLIFPVKSKHAPNYAPNPAPHWVEFPSSDLPQGPSTVKSGHSRNRSSFPGPMRSISLWARLFVVVLLAASSAAALAQALTIEQIRVIGNRRIPKETVLARLFTHVGDTYDPVSIERDFNSLWNTGYFEDLRIEREDSEKGVILISI